VFSLTLGRTDVLGLGNKGNFGLPKGDSLFAFAAKLNDFEKMSLLLSLLLFGLRLPVVLFGREEM
jgi:hypothetical protein